MKTRLSKRVGILAFVVTSLLVGGTVLARDQTQAVWAQIGDKLDQIINLLTPGAPVPGPVTLKTALVFHPGFSTFCIVTNVGTTPITFEVRVIDFNGTLVASESPTVSPGQNAFTDPVLGHTPLRCEFSFVGFADDVRATILNDGPDSGGNPRNTVLEAR